MYTPSDVHEPALPDSVSIPDDDDEITSYQLPPEVEAAAEVPDEATAEAPGEVPAFFVRRKAPTEEESPTRTRQVRERLAQLMYEYAMYLFPQAHKDGMLEPWVLCHGEAEFMQFVCAILHMIKAHYYNPDRTVMGHCLGPFEASDEIATAFNTAFNLAPGRGMRLGWDLGYTISRKELDMVPSWAFDHIARVMDVHN